MTLVTDQGGSSQKQSGSRCVAEGTVKRSDRLDVGCEKNKEWVHYSEQVEGWHCYKQDGKNCK